MRFDGRTALVTGAARGIGLAIAERLLAEGARVALVDRDAEVEAVAERLGASARGLVADVTVTADVDGAVAAAHAWADRLDVVVNNAGITGRSYPIWELTDADWQQVIAIDLTSVFLVCRAAVKLMLPRQYGRIVNIASVAGLQGAHPELMRAIAYQTTKGGLVNFTRGLAAEWGRHHIVVNAICPGFIVTKMSRGLLDKISDRVKKTSPLGQLGLEQDMQGLTVMLSSAAARHITGQIIAVDGGSGII